MRLPNEPETPLQINIVPAIDVIFVILVYFIVSSLFLTRSEGLPVNLPQAASGTTQESQRLTVSIEPDGALFLNETAIQLDDLKAGIVALAGAESGAVVIINADEAVNHGRVVSVMDRVRQVPGVRLAIATQQPR